MLHELKLTPTKPQSHHKSANAAKELVDVIRLKPRMQLPTDTPADRTAINPATDTRLVPPVPSDAPTNRIESQTPRSVINVTSYLAKPCKPIVYSTLTCHSRGSS